jgi:threonyl-tRNA synthetase
MLIVEGRRENGTISIRRHGQEGKGNIVTIEEFVTIVNEEINKTLKVFTV